MVKKDIKRKQGVICGPDLKNNAPIHFLHLRQTLQTCANLVYIFDTIGRSIPYICQSTQGVTILFPKTFLNPNIVYVYLCESKPPSSGYGQTTYQKRVVKNLPRHVGRQKFTDHENWLMGGPQIFWSTGSLSRQINNCENEKGT